LILDNHWFWLRNTANPSVWNTAPPHRVFPVTSRIASFFFPCYAVGAAYHSIQAKGMTANFAATAFKATPPDGIGRW
jgi:hypothetical protein